MPRHQVFKTRRNELDRKAKHKGKRFDESIEDDMRKVKLIDTRSMASRQNAVNKYLADVIGRKYWDGIPLDAIFEKLRENGFEPVQEDQTAWSGIIAGRDGNTRIELKTGGPKRWLSLSYHKMDVSGRYEVTAYIS